MSRIVEALNKLQSRHGDPHAATTHHWFCGVLSGLLNTYSGEVNLLDRDLRSYSQRELARQIAVVPQETHVSFPFTALEIVLLGRAPHLGVMELEK